MFESINIKFGTCDVNKLIPDNTWSVEYNIGSHVCSQDDSYRIINISDNSSGRFVGDGTRYFLNSDWSVIVDTTPNDTDLSNVRKKIHKIPKDS